MSDKVNNYGSKLKWLRGENFMNQMVTLLQEIVHTAVKTQQTLKTIVLYIEPSSIQHIDHLDLLLNKIKISSISSEHDIIADTDEMSIQYSIQTLFSCMHSIDEISNTLKLTTFNTLPEDLTRRLDKNMQSLRNTFLQLNSCFTQTFGKDKSYLANIL